MRFGVIGGGSWGTSLGNVLSINKHQVVIYTNREEVKEDINASHMNSRYFPFPHKLEKSLLATTSLNEALNDVEGIIIAVPTSSYREVLEKINAILDHKVYFISVGKGFDPITHQRLSSLIREVIPEEKRYPVISLIGPSFAKEVLQKQLTCITAAGLDEKSLKVVQKAFSNDFFRVYINEDEIGAEYAAAIKNVIAIASGIAVGLGYKDDPKAALVTRGLHEVSKFGVLKGGKENTFFGLSGVGDLILTCSSLNSRNFQAGLQIGKENTSANFLKANKSTVEGVKTCKVIYDEAKKMKVEMPIVEAVYQVLYLDKSPKDVVKNLMLRSLKSEF